MSHERARQLIDAVHSADPSREPGGQPAELLYADRMEQWVCRLVPEASPVLRLAARCQHLERWLVPRASYPEGRAGYLKWRQGLYRRQADRARELFIDAGISKEDADAAATWISKTDLATNPGTQSLEDAACLVFLENQIADFAAEHAHYPREKFIRILQKAWGKMSPAARQAALGLPHSPEIAALIAEALA